MTETTIEPLTQELLEWLDEQLGVCKSDPGPGPGRLPNKVIAIVTAWPVVPPEQLGEWDQGPLAQEVVTTEKFRELFKSRGRVESLFTHQIPHYARAVIHYECEPHTDYLYEFFPVWTAPGGAE